MAVAARPAVSILIPTRNEVENIDPLLRRVEAVAEHLDMEVLVADGCSTDGTADRVRAWTGRMSVRLVASNGKRGLAGDILHAAAQARGDIVVVMDADLSHPPERIRDLVQPILAGSADMVIGSRYVAGGATPGWPLRRRLASRLAAVLAWPLADARDPLAGFFAVRRERLLAVDPGAEGFKIGLEILARGGDALNVAEVAIEFHDRERGRSKMGMGQALSYVRRLAALAGGAVSRSTATRFALVGLMGLVVDLAAFQSLYAAGVGFAPAHLLSFALATLVNYTANARWAFTRTALEWGAFARSLLSALLALGLRGAAIAWAVKGWGWPPQAAIVTGIAAAALVNYLGAALFVFPHTQAIRPEQRWRVAALGVLAYSLVLRFLYMGQIDLLPEEAYYWNYAQHADLGYIDHPPMVAWLIWLGTQFFGHSEFAIRIGALACWLVAASFAFALARNLYNKSTAFRAVLLMAALPFFFAVGVIMTPDAPLVACWAGALHFLERALRGGRRSAWWGVGACIGLGLLSKYTIAVLAPPALAFLVLHPPARRWLLRPEPYLAAALALLLFAPVIIWNARNDWASFAFQGPRRLAEAAQFSAHELGAAVLLFLTPMGLVAAIGAVLGRSTARSGPRHAPQAGNPHLFVTLFTLLPLAVFAIFSVRHEVKLNWTGPLWLATLPAIAWRIAPSGPAGPAALWRGRAWTATIAVALLAYAAGLHYLVLGLPGIGYPQRMHLPVGWRELGTQVSAIDEELESQTGRECLFIGLDKYFITSELSFYDEADGSAEAAGRHLIGGSALMYERWFPPRQHTGKPAILVSFKRGTLDDGSINRYFERLEAIQERHVERDGIVVGRYFYRIGYGYRPHG